MIECLLQRHFIEFLELVATYTIVFGATLSDVNIGLQYKWWHRGSSISDEWNREDYVKALYHTMGGPEPCWTEFVLVPVHYKAFHEIPKLPKEYEDVMIRPISSIYKMPEFKIRLNKPYMGLSADDHWPAGGYMFPFYAVFDAGFTY